MRTTGRFPSLAGGVLFVVMLTVSATDGLAQSSPLQPLTDPGVVPDEMLTLVVATRFVSPPEDGMTAKAQFTDARIPLSKFNATDHCVDQRALQLAKEYFTNLGRVLGKAGHYYFVPDDEIRQTATKCEKVHHLAPKAWIDKKTSVIAFGRVVPTRDAPTLERSVR